MRGTYSPFPCWILAAKKTLFLTVNIPTRLNQTFMRVAAQHRYFCVNTQLYMPHSYNCGRAQFVNIFLRRKNMLFICSHRPQPLKRCWTWTKWDSVSQGQKLPLDHRSSIELIILVYKMSHVLVSSPIFETRWYWSLNLLIYNHNYTFIYVYYLRAKYYVVVMVKKHAVPD